MGNLDLPELAQIGTVGINYGCRIVVDPIDGNFVDGQDNDHVVFFCILAESFRGGP